MRSASPYIGELSRNVRAGVERRADDVVAALRHVERLPRAHADDGHARAARAQLTRLHRHLVLFVFGSASAASRARRARRARAGRRGRGSGQGVGVRAYGGAYPAIAAPRRAAPSRSSAGVAVANDTRSVSRLRLARVEVLARARTRRRCSIARARIASAS